MIISTSARHPGYVPWILLKHYDVEFNGRGLGVNGPDGMKIAKASQNGEKGHIVLNNGRRLIGNVVIRANPPF